MSKLSFYCWLKVTPRSRVKDGPRPPSRTSNTKPTGVAEEWGGVVGRWNQPLAANWVLDYGEAFSDEKEAVMWITTAGGIEWLKEAQSYSLAKFEIAVTTRSSDA